MKMANETGLEGLIYLQAPQPFSLSETIGYLSRSANECLFHVESGRVYRLIEVGGERVVVEISGHDTTVNIRCHSDNPLTSSVRDAVAGHVWEWFDFDRDLPPFYEQMEYCPWMKEVARAYYGLRIVSVVDLFEALCWAIMGQQINLTFAYMLKRRFVESFGVQQQWAGRNYWLFPRPEAIAQLHVDDLLGLQFTRRKAEYVLAVARRMAEGSLSKHGLLRTGDFQAARRELIKIRGIGPWTANYVLMRCLRDPSAFPVEDVGLQNAVKATRGMDRKPSIAELREMAVGWAGWEAYATFYLWRSLYQTVGG